MSFSIIAAGTVDQVRDQVKAAEPYGDTTQFDTARSLILAELDAWPATAHESYQLGLFVEATGHHDNHSRNLSIVLRPIYLPRPANPE